MPQILSLAERERERELIYFAVIRGLRTPACTHTRTNTLTHRGTNLATGISDKSSAVSIICMRIKFQIYEASVWRTRCNCATQLNDDARQCEVNAVHAHAKFIEWNVIFVIILLYFHAHSRTLHTSLIFTLDYNPKNRFRWMALRRVAAACWRWCAREQDSECKYGEMWRYLFSCEWHKFREASISIIYRMTKAKI